MSQPPTPERSASPLKRTAPFLRVVEKAFRVLETVAQAETGVRVSDLARALGQPKATIYRILFTLQELGYVRQDSRTRAYVSTAHAASLTQDRANETLRQLAAPHMKRLLGRFEQTVNLAIFDRDRVFYIDILPGLRSIRMEATPMTYAPMHSTAVGKAILAFLEPEEVQRILKARSLEKYTRATITAVPLLLKYLKRARTKGYAVDNQETEIGARCVAAPIFNAHGLPIAAISVSGPVTYMTAQTIEHVARALRVANYHVSRQLGFIADRDARREASA